MDIKPYNKDLVQNQRDWSSKYRMDLSKYLHKGNQQFLRINPAWSGEQGEGMV